MKRVRLTHETLHLHLGFILPPARPPSFRCRHVLPARPPVEADLALHLVMRGYGRGQRMSPGTTIESPSRSANSSRLSPVRTFTAYTTDAGSFPLKSGEHGQFRVVQPAPEL